MIGAAPPAWIDRLSPGQSRAVDAIAERALRAYETPAVSVAIVRDGRVAFAKGYGFRDRARSLRADAATCYGVGSVTKTLVAALVLQLAEQHALSLDDPTTRYLPLFTSARDVRIRHLLSQTSGIRDYNDALFLATVLPHVLPGRVDRGAMLRALARWPLAFAPGSRFAYSNANYLLLGTIAERATGTPLAALLQQRIFEPLGMTDSALRDDCGTRAGDATGYTKSPVGPAAVPPWDAQLTYAAGGVSSTVLDLAKFDVALVSGRVVSATSFAGMRTGFALPDGRSAYGFGLFAHANEDSRVVWQDGTVLGFRAMNALLPNERHAVIVLANSDYFHAQVVAMEIERTLDGVSAGPEEGIDPSLPRWSMSIGFALAGVVLATSLLLRRRRVAAAAAAVATYATTAIFPPAGIGAACASLLLVVWPRGRGRRD